MFNTEPLTITRAKVEINSTEVVVLLMTWLKGKVEKGHIREKH